MTALADRILAALREDPGLTRPRRLAAGAVLPGGHLDLEGLGLGEELARVLAAARPGALRGAWLAGNALRAAGPLVELLARQPALARLDLADNPLGDAEAATLALALARHAGLRALGVARCGLGPPSAELLATVCAESGVVELTLARRGLSEATDGEESGAAGTAEMSRGTGETGQRSPGRENRLGDAGVAAFAAALRRGAPWEALALPDPGPAGRAALLAAAGESSRLCRLAIGALAADERAGLTAHLCANANRQRGRRPPATLAALRRGLPADEPVPAAPPGWPAADEVAACLRVLSAMSLRPGLLAHPHAAALRAALARVQRDGRREERRAARAARAAAERARRAAEDRRAVEAAANRTRVGGVAATAVEDDPGRTIATLHAERPCYVCKRGYRRVHFFYARLCPDCAADSYARRCEVVDLRGRTAVVTGGRIKIGHQVALRLLAWGARVVVTSRFPGDTARRFAADPRFAGFRERLHVHALDLRALPAVEAFAARLVAEHPRIDVLVNNAAQTVRRPPAFYAGLLAAEDRAALPAGLAEAAGALPGGGELFPAGSDDGFGQPLDLRGRNSWRLRLDEVGTVELVEVQLINAVAPFMLVGRLRRAMARPGGAAFVVNVSAPEGRFDRVYKSEFHPHTNMAKAALNMMTRTSAEDFARDGIYMTAVDTGWVSNENPAPVAAAMAAGGFVPPLDLVDAATRVCDPVARGVRDGELLCGVFLKDFRPVSW